MAQFESLIRKQEDLVHSISRVTDNFKKLGIEKRTALTLEARLSALESAWAKFQLNHESILEIQIEAHKQHAYYQQDRYNSSQEIYLEQKEFVQHELRQRRASTPKDADTSFRHTASTASLPKNPLPRFSGQYQDWGPFKNLFASLIHQNEELTDVQRLHYLRTHVAGEAAGLITNLPLTDENFARAWATLESRYDHRRRIIDSHLDAIFKHKALLKESACDLKRLCTSVSEALAALESIGAPLKQWDWILVYHVSRLLDPSTHRAWETSLGGSRDPSSMEELMAFLDNRIRTFEVLESRKPGVQEKTIVQTKPTNKQPSAQVNTTTTYSSTCAWCGEGHYIASCPQYIESNIERRYRFVREKNLCFNCLGYHNMRACRSTKTCKHCHSNHHTSIHDAVKKTSPAASASCNTAMSVSANHALLMADSAPSTILLATATATLVTEQGQQKVRMLLDQGSEISFVRESVIQTFRIPRRRSSITLIGVGATETGSTRGVASITIPSLTDSTGERTIQSHILTQLAGVTPKTRTPDCSKWSHLSELTLADPRFDTPGQIDIIIGADYLGSMLRPGLRQGDHSQPVGQNTIFGWVISGPTGTSAAGSERQAYHTTIAENKTLSDLVERFWSLEQVNPHLQPLLTPDELACETHFLKTHSRDEDGRYVVRLPFRESPKPLGNSRIAAEQALQRVHRRSARDSTFKDLYHDFLNEYQRLGHMSMLPNNKPDEPLCYYLPHHGVLRATSTTTRLRVVFNVSSKTDLNLSLNHCLLPGPKLQTDIDDVILRWRRYPVVFSCHLEKMYRQIKIHHADRRFQQILWSPTPTESARIYQLNTVTYGLTSAPFLALRVLKQLAIDEGKKYPLAAAAVQRDMYVDDVLSGAYDVHTAQRTVQQLKRLLSAGGFTTHKWMSNDPSVFEENISNQDNTISFDSIEDESVMRTLGLSWNVKLDSFFFNATLGDSPKEWTKRQVLSTIARIFDPLGWLAPYIITAKILLQRMWTTSLKWDDALPPLVLGSWCAFHQDLTNLNKLSIPRWLGTMQNSRVEIHGFSDASQDAVAACVYLHVHADSQQPARCTLLAARTRVAPLKKLTIPRLELSAAVLLARLVSKTRRCLQLDNAPVYAWTDSSVVLYWIRGPSTRWKEFVANRVNTINELLPNSKWNHIPGVGNPADMASRGITLEQLQQSELWWQGPSWLTEPKTGWPSSPFTLPSDLDLEERKQAKLVATTITVSEPWDIICRFSKLSRLLRVTAYLFRAAAGFRRLDTRPKDPSLTTDELWKAKQFWILKTQRSAFNDILDHIKRGRALDKNCPFKTLTPFLDNEGILRVGGRVTNSFLDPDATHPVILPTDSELTRLIVHEAHCRTLHGGVQSTLSTVRQEYWVPSGRRLVKAYILRCVICTRHRAKAAQQLMGQLPRTRVTPSRPFQHSGVDYAGPFHLKTWRGRASRTYKAYLVLFVCFSTSAVHLELATDYTTEGFLAAYRRFCGRRGACTTLTSDCGSNFVGADAELKKLFKAASQEVHQLKDALSLVGTNWQFNPPGAPHFGGKWEAAVKSTKFHLKRVIGDAKLTYEEFSTTLTQIEGILNSRPLCPLSDDPTDLSALTPSHFLIGAPLTSFPEPCLLDVPQSRLTRWQLVHQTIQWFWRRWSAEYLQRLQSISKWRTKSPSLTVGALVLLMDDRLPPTKWSLARVTEVHPGSDGLVRVATVRTSSTVYRRPISKLCILPISSPHES